MSKTLERTKISSNITPLAEDLKPVFNINPYDVEDNRGALATLPLVREEYIDKRRGVQLLRTGVVEFPVERIVANNRDTDWSGGASTKRTQDGNEASSYDLGMQFASGQIPTTPVTLRLFKDSAGEVWARAYDGTHRVIGAKANGLQSMEAVIDWPADGQLDFYPGDVVAEHILELESV